MIRNIFSKIKKFFQDRETVVVFFVLTIFVVAPLFFHRGFIFLLDWAPMPRTPFPIVRFDPFFLFEFVWWMCNLVLPGGIIQNFFLGGIFFLAGLGMFRFLQKNNIGLWGNYFGGIFYMFNPFVYSRILTGQWPIIAGYALLPWFLISLPSSLELMSWYRMWRVAFFWTIITVMNIHAGIFASILFVIFGTVTILISSKDFHVPLKNYATIFLLFLLLNAYWLVPAFFGGTALGEFAGKVIDEKHIFSFFTRADPQHGVLWNTAAMYGFWGDEDMRYVSQKMFVSYWFYIFFVLFALVLWGLAISLRRCFWRKKNPERLKNEILLRQPADQDDTGGSFATFPPEAGRQDDNTLLDFFQWWVVAPLILIGLVAFFFAVGVAYEPFKPTVLWFYNNVPFFRGFREPQKFVALLVFVYAIFSAIGVDDILRRIESLRAKKLRFLKMIAPAFFLLIPLAYSSGMLWGFHGQIKPSNYPESWFQVDQQLQNDADDFRVLFLPWHQYIYLKFARTVIANPAERFFHKPTIAGDNMEFGPIYTQSTRSESKYIEEKIIQRGKDFISDKGKGTVSLGQTLLPLKIKYIIMAKDSDFFNYAYVPDSPDMKLVYDSPELAVYENLTFGKR